MAMPFFIPRCVEIEPGWIGDFFDCCRLAFIAARFGGLFLGAFPFSKLIRNPPACDVQQPTFE